jgi:hypothetical protein
VQTGHQIKKQQCIGKGEDYPPKGGRVEREAALYSEHRKTIEGQLTQTIIDTQLIED